MTLIFGEIYLRRSPSDQRLYQKSSAIRAIPLP